MGNLCHYSGGSRPGQDGKRKPFVRVFKEKSLFPVDFSLGFDYNKQVNKASYMTDG